ncbi:MAG: major facilitator superfamily transporter [Pelotomaculum sp. PtaB.Bin013]|uniref:MFS transporter n=1 Tax=Pelotomaculum isophthalicicum JI TaxID=947010 RepID=A0A9X4H370_9FIRM|nr:MFS transporter [Pelotomaculum isophthalicicum]MDF9409456.1 MFS transporter [Pelotomaculum isophthalicicum JI]OPX81124.1 MAG: major facilitator superfamily transporter [Pelotomaculum sp. PtaB.Bin013]
MNAPKLWTKDFLIISLENFFVYFTYNLLIAIIAVYATDRFNASPSVAGLSAGIFILGAIGGRLYAGSSIERIGRKKMLYISFAFYLMTTLLYFGVYSLTFLLILRMFHGAAFGMASTATGTISAEIIPNERRGEGTSYYALSMTLATAIGPFLGMFLTQHANFNVNLIVCAIALGVSFIVAFPLDVPKVEPTNKKFENMELFNLNGFIEPKAVPIAIITALTCFSYSSILSFMATYSKEINLINAGSFFFIFYAVAILISRPFTGRWFDIKGENFVIYPAFLLFAIALIVLGRAHQGSSVLLAGVLAGFGYGNIFSSAQALAVKVSPQHRKALATSTFFIFADVGMGIGPFILGFLIPTIGYRGLYVSMGIVVFATFFLYYFLQGRKSMSHVSAAE